MMQNTPCVVYLSEWLTDNLKRTKISQKELAQMTGVSAAAISQYKKGSVTVCNNEILMKLAQAFGTEVPILKRPRAGYVVPSDDSDEEDLQDNKYQPERESMLPDSVSLSPSDNSTKRLKEKILDIFEVYSFDFLDTCDEWLNRESAQSKKNALKKHSDSKTDKPDKSGTPKGAYDPGNKTSANTGSAEKSTAQPSSSHLPAQSKALAKTPSNNTRERRESVPATPGKKTDISSDGKGIKRASNDIPSLSGLIDMMPVGTLVRLPIFDSVSAGLGAYADDSVMGYRLSEVPNPLEKDNYFFVNVHGDSMEPLIPDGSMVLVHKQDFVENNKVAILLVDGEEALVKRIKYRAGHVELLSENSMYKPRVFENDDVLRIKVLGMVVECVMAIS